MRHPGRKAISLGAGAEPQGLQTPELPQPVCHMATFSGLPQEESHPGFRRRFAAQEIC